MDEEVICVDRLQDISECLKLVAVGYACLPCIHRDAVHLKGDVLSVRTHAVRPVIIGIDLRIEGHLREDEPCHRAGDASVVTALKIASLGCKVRYGLDQLVIYEVHDRAAFGLGNVIHR